MSESSPSSRLAAWLRWALVLLVVSMAAVASGAPAQKADSVLVVKSEKRL
ncbi:MAG: hypothetical protein AAGE01_07475 [Pseudomonadota bacterium]